ncbi:pinensin family lanthipeptide, partial [Xanthovirga aplysinae]
SFVTSLENEKAKTAKGGGRGDGSDGLCKEEATIYNDPMNPKKDNC